MSKPGMFIPCDDGDINCPICDGALDDEIGSREVECLTDFVTCTGMQCVYCDKWFQIDWEIVAKPIRLTEMKDAYN
jgi:hypothetical protein